MPSVQLPLDIRLFEWLDHNGWAYWLAAWSAFALVVATALAPIAAAPTAAASQPSPDRRPGWLRLLGSPASFAIAVLLVFAAFRWPAWLAGPLENPDEDQWIAGALTLRDGGLPWKHLDGHTSGPLNPATLLLTIPLGLPLNHVGVRALAALLQALAALALWRAARHLVPEWAARLAVLPAVNLWACRWFHDMVQYSSEQTPVLLLALGAWAGIAGWGAASARRALPLLGLAGALCTTPLFAKPQALPLAAALGGVLLWAVWNKRSPSGESLAGGIPWARAAALVLGALIPVAAFGGYITIFGLWQQIRVFFWQANVAYTGARTFGALESPRMFLDLVDPIPGALAAIVGVLGFSFLASAADLAERARRSRLIVAWLFVVVAFVTVMSPGRVFRHYLHFLVLPLGWLAAVGLDAAGRRLAGSALLPSRKVLAGLAAIFLTLTTLVPAWRTARQAPPMNGQLYFWRERQTSIVGEFLRGSAEPGDKLVVWGWMPRYHVESGLGQGAREAHSERMINAGPLQDAYRARFLFDLRRNRPRWFVDAVAPRQFGYDDRTLFGHENWPALREFIAAHYEFIDDFDGVRIYRRTP